MESPHQFDVLARDALSARLERYRARDQDWSTDIVYQVFGVLCQASGGLVTERDVTMVPPDLMAIVMGVKSGSGAGGGSNDSDATTNGGGAITVAATRLVDLIHGSRMILFPLSGGGSGSAHTISVMAAYVPEWKHWYMCSDPRRGAKVDDAMAHLFIQLSGLNIVAEYNHGFQYYPLSPPSLSNDGTTAASNTYASLCSYVMLKNIKHFAYRNEFSACLTNELGSILNEHSRAGYMQHVSNLLSVA